MKKPDALEIITTLDLKPHPEGGFYRETYRAQEEILALKSSTTPLPRHVSTGIYFLLPKGSHSKLHRIRSDEMWHFYLGDPLTIIELTTDGKLIKTSLGTNFAKGERPQYLVRAGHWFGTYPNPESDTEFSLVGCTVAPGFDFQDLEFGNREDLLSKFPQAKEEILKLT